MKKEKVQLQIGAHTHPNVLLLGNGMIKLSDKETATGWDELLKKLKTRKGDINIESIPYAMQPEALCGVDVEEIQRKMSGKLHTIQNSHHLVNELIGLPFDAIITTNYTYEIEMVLSGKKWTVNDRKRAFTALDGNSKVNHNTFICNTVKTMDGKTIPVFHIHGECERKHSMILSYYSYSKALAHLVSYNKLLGNKLYEFQQEGETYNCKCWLDYYLMGNVWAVGFGFDFSEFDIWWATERKAREKAAHGKLKVYMSETDQGFASKKDLLNAMDADCCIYNTEEIGFEKMYEKVIEDIKADMEVCCNNTMKNELLTIYPILWLVLTFAGVKFSGRRTVAKEFLSLEQTKLIRGSACIGVMIHHVTQQITSYGSADKGVITLFNYGGILFTALFFFFSGYGLILNVYNKKDYLHTFLTKRLPAVLIPFWLINFVVVTIKILFLNVRYVPAEAVKDILGIKLLNGNGWFIIEIVVIYLAFFLLFDLIKKKDVAFTLLCIFVILLIRFAFFRGHDNPGAKSSWFRGEWWFNSTITFVFGMFFARFREKILRVVNRFYVVFLPLTAVLFVVAFYFSRLAVTRLGYYGTFQVGMTTRSMFLTLLAQSAACIVSTLLVLLINMRLTFGNPVLKYIGSISMEFFLIHGYFVNQIFGSMKLADIPRYAVCFVTSLACTAVAAPIINLIKKKVIVLTGRLEIYDLFPTADFAEKLKIGNMRKQSGKIIAVVVILLALIPIGFVVRYISLKNEFEEEFRILKDAEPGDEVLWGRFQTDLIPGRERLIWIVLENKDGGVLLITKQGVAGATYNQKHDIVSWEESDIFGLINSESAVKCFSKDELAHMSCIDGGYLTLLTESEVKNYFPTERERELSITEAAQREGTNINSMSKANEWDLKGYRSSWWWLRGEGEDVYAPIVTVDGEISQKEVNRPGGAVRPVIYIDLTK